MTPKRLLYVETTPGNDLYYQLTLQNHGFAVNVADDARTALGLHDVSMVDVVVISQDPASADRGSDGFRLAADIKRQTPELPIVMVSGCESVVEDAPRFVDGAFWNSAPTSGLIEMLQRLTARPGLPARSFVLPTPAFVA